MTERDGVRWITRGGRRAASATAARSGWKAWHTVVCPLLRRGFISYIDRTNISVASIAMKEQFGWTETTKGFVLSSFFVGYLLLQVVSGTLANKYGGKIVLGVAVLWWSLFTMLTPPAAMLSLSALIGARIALGLGEAAVFPASINMIGRWVPVASRLARRRVVHERTVARHGGVASAHGLAHPRVWLADAVLRLRHRRVRVGRGLGSRSWQRSWRRSRASAGRTPADSMAQDLRTPAVWAIIINHFCSNWTLYVLLAWLPSYFKTTFGVSLANAGSSLGGAVAHELRDGATSPAHLADGMINARPTLRRSYASSCRRPGCSAPRSFYSSFIRRARRATGMLLMCGATGTLALCIAGYTVNSFDIAPRYADVIWGISNTFATVPGIVGVAVTGWLVRAHGNVLRALRRHRGGRRWWERSCF